MSDVALSCWIGDEVASTDREVLMAKYRVIAHCMHEHELDVAKQLVKGGVATEGFVVGEVDEADMEKLREAGLVVQRLGERPGHKLHRRPLRMRRPVAPSGFLGIARAEPEPSVTIPAGAETQYRVSLAGPLVGTWRSELEAAGATVCEAVSDEAVRVLMPSSEVHKVELLPFVLSVEPWAVEAATEAEDVMAVAVAPGGITEVATYDVILVGPDKREAVTAWLDSRHVLIAAEASDKIRIHLPQTSTIASELQQRTDWVLLVEPFVQPKLHNDRARILLGVDGGGAGAASVPLDGQDQVIGVADTGIDEQHPDFAGRLPNVIPLGRPGDASDPHGHGTHVAGSIAGDGQASGGQLRGMAPKAKVVFQSLLDAEGGLGGLPFRLQDLFQEAYDLGARIHNNSWGAATASEYRINCREVDDFVHNHRDMLVVISAGNEGTAANPPLGGRSSQPGFVDWLSIGSPATAKNALTVGASRSDRTSGGYSQLTYGAAWPSDFPNDPIADALVSSNPQCISGFSSRGPCNDYRIKPDVVAPGTDIVSCRSHRAPLRNFWGPYSTNPKYAYMGGTSMAAPLVTGCAALVREYFVSRRGHQPSAALLKAVLINGARWLTGADATADHAIQPNYHQGFGCVNLPDSLPDLLDHSQRLEFVDNWQQPASQLGSDERRRYRFTVDAAGPINLCLAYTDPPGRALQNNLNLLLEVPGGGPKLFGNMHLPMGLNQPDAVNNIEVIRITDSPAGDYLVQVTATSILQGPQDFALVVTGRLSTDLQPI